MIRNLRRVHIGSSRRQCRTPTLSTVDDDRTTSSSSLSSSFAWGAAAAAAAALSSNDDTPPLYRQWSNSNGRRGYGTTTAFCAAPKQPNKSSYRLTNLTIPSSTWRSNGQDVCQQRSKTSCQIQMFMQTIILMSQ